MTDSGTAIPIANTLDILSAVTAAGTHPIQTTGATNVVTLNVQKSQALAAADATKIGLSNFSSAHFTVDANGFVDLAGGAVTETLTGNSGGAVGPDGSNNINVVGNGTTITIAGNPATHTLTASVTGAVGQTITGNSGGALAPTAGNWNILGASTAAGATPVTTSGAVSTLTVNVQKSQAIAATDATKVGLCNFNSSMFSVDANGFVALSGGGQAIDSIGTQTGTNPISPDGTGLVTINGATVAAGTHPVRTDGTGANTMAVEVQISQAIAATDATKIGLAAFDSADFTVDANGFVSAATTGFLKTLTGNSGGAISPTASNINTLGTGSITISGAGSTLTTQLTGLTNHAIQIGAGTATLTQLAATATTGQILQNNAAADPSWSTATYPSTTTINQILYSSSANVVAGLATANNGVLTTGTTGIPVITALGVDGQVIIGSSAGAPAAATISAGTGITITNGHNSISIAASATGVVQTLTGNSGGAISPTAGNINTLGTGSITIAGSGSTLTTQLTGLTNHAIQIGAGTATLTQLGAGTTGQVLQTNTGADPTWSTATYPSTTTINQVLYSSSANVVSGLATANNGVHITGTTGIPSVLAAGTTGQVLTATTGSPPSWASPASSSITITGDSGGGLTGSSFTFTGGTTGLTFAGAGTTETLGGTLVLANGGTSAALTASNGGIFYSTATAGAILSGTATAGQIIRSGASAAPTWSTSTYPATNAVSTLLYASSANVMAALSTANTGVLVTNGSGVPAWQTSSTSWTPNIQINSSSTGITYTTQTGYYIQLGSMVFIYVNIALSNKGAGSGNVTISNLPVTSGAHAQSGMIAVPYYGSITNVGYNSLSLFVTNSSTVGTFYMASMTGSGAAVIPSSSITNTFTCIFQGFYITD